MITLIIPANGIERGKNTKGSELSDGKEIEEDQEIDTNELFGSPATKKKHSYVYVV